MGDKFAIVFVSLVEEAREKPSQDIEAEIQKSLEEQLPSLFPWAESVKKVVVCEL